MGNGFLYGKPALDKSKGLTAGVGDISLGKTAAVDREIITGTAEIIPAEVIVPSTTMRQIPAGGFTDGTITITGDPKLVPENIKSGTSIFNVAGSFSNPSTLPGFIAANKIKESAFAHPNTSPEVILTLTLQPNTDALMIKCNGSGLYYMLSGLGGESTLRIGPNTLVVSIESGVATFTYTTDVITYPYFADTVTELTM